MSIPHFLLPVGKNTYNWQNSLTGGLWTCHFLGRSKAKISCGIYMLTEPLSLPLSPPPNPSPPIHPQPRAIPYIVSGCRSPCKNLPFETCLGFAVLPSLKPRIWQCGLNIEWIWNNCCMWNQSSWGFYDQLENGAYLKFQVLQKGCLSSWSHQQRNLKSDWWWWIWFPDWLVCTRYVSSSQDIAL